MKRSYSQIDLDERRKIARWRQAGARVEVIAEKLGRHRSTIFREIARNKFEDVEMPDLAGYFCVMAHGKAKDRRSRHRKPVRHPTVTCGDYRTDQAMNAAASVCAMKRSTGSPIQLMARR